MRFSDERYVRFYTRKTVTWKKLGWEGRAVWHALLCEFDRAGIFSLSGEDPVVAIFIVSEIPENIVRAGLARLLEFGTVVHVQEGDALYAPHFMEAQEAQHSNALRQRTKRERVKARQSLRELGVTPRVASDTHRYSELEDTDEPDSGPELNGSDVVVTPRVDSSHDVSVATRNDTLKPSLAKPSLAKLSDPSLKSKSDLDRRSDQQALRAPARESGLAQAPEQSGRVGLDRPKHPDEDFTDDMLPVAAGAYVPSPWLQAEALASGFDRAALHRTLERYRERSNLPADATQSRHDKAFKGWLKNRKFDERPSAPPSPRSNGGEKIPSALLPPEQRPPVHPLDAAGYALKPPWHPDFQKKQEAK